MKKIIAFIALLLSISFVAKTQVYLGISTSRYISKLYNDNIQYSGLYEKGDYLLKYETETLTYIAIFPKGNICEMVICSPKTRGALNRLIEKYNDEAVINSEGNWTLYLEGNNNPIDIQMLRIESKIGYCFVFTSH